jgi:N-acetylmuramoyl-L-alanine amidase
MKESGLTQASKSITQGESTMSNRLITSLLSIALLASFVPLSGCQNSDADLPPLPSRPAAMVVPPSQPYAPPVYAPQGQARAQVPMYTYTPPSPKPAVGFGAVPASWIPKVKSNHWLWIIVHHSDSDYGSAAIIDQWHRQRGFDELGYHFVIDNGRGGADGQIEVGPRWPVQKWGAHDNALDNRYNLYGIGICLVGDFNKTHPTVAQRRSLIRLVTYLMQKYNIPADHVLGHGETKDTECPGKYLHVADIRTVVAKAIALGHEPSDEELDAFAADW